MIGGNVAASDGKGTKCVDLFELIQLLAEHPIFRCGSFMENFLSITEQNLDALGRLPQTAVLHKDQGLPPGRFQDQFNVTANDNAGRFKVIITDVDQAGTNLAIRIGDFNALLNRAVIIIILDLHFPGLVRLNQCHIQMVHIADGMGLSEVGFQIQEILLHRDLLDVAGRQTNNRLLIGEEDLVRLERE